jgi:hypothetical protein
MFEIHIKTIDPHKNISICVLKDDRTLNLEAARTAAITPARNCQALFCGAKYGVVPRLEIWSKPTKGRTILKETIAKIDKNRVGAK